MRKKSRIFTLTKNHVFVIVEALKDIRSEIEFEMDLDTPCVDIRLPGRSGGEITIGGIDEPEASGVAIISQLKGKRRAFNIVFAEKDKLRDKLSEIVEVVLLETIGTL